MARERKVVPHFRKDIHGRAVTGIFSVFGNIDQYKDVVMPNSFTKTFAERGDDIFHLWQHDFESPAIAVIQDLRELRQDELTDEIKRKYPEAIGGAQVTREYLETERGGEILKGHVAGVPYKMSFAFDPVKFDLGELHGEKVRYLRENRLHETSDVLWGANDATVASKMPLDILLRQIELHVKDGAPTPDLINQIASVVAELGATNIKRISAPPTTKEVTTALHSLKGMEEIWRAQSDSFGLADGAGAFSSLAYLLARACDDPVAAAPLLAALRLLIAYLSGEINGVEAQIAAGAADVGLQLASLQGLELQMKALLKAGARHNDSDLKLLNTIHKAVVDLGATNCKGIVGDEDKADLIIPAPVKETSRAEEATPLHSLTLMRHQRQTLDLLDFIGAS